MTEPEASRPAPSAGQNILGATASRDCIVAIMLAMIAAIVFFKTTKPTQQHFDYTFRIATALLHGHIGLEVRQASWLNEMVPRDGRLYSVCPLGAVASILPVALLQRAHCIANPLPTLANLLPSLRKSLPGFIWFLIIPVVLGLLTAAYNFARFHSIFDFGYAHVPNLMREPWYQRGLFSIHAIPWNMQKSLFEGFNDYPHFPYIRFFPFGCSIFLASPFLFLLFREGGRFKVAAWIAIGLLTAVLWCHGNPGGWQFSYRYAMVLLPWMFLLLVENGPARISAIECALLAVSVAINAAE